MADVSQRFFLRGSPTSFLFALPLGICDFCTLIRAGRAFWRLKISDAPNWNNWTEKKLLYVLNGHAMWASALAETTSSKKETKHLLACIRYNSCNFFLQAAGVWTSDMCGYYTRWTPGKATKKSNDGESGEEVNAAAAAAMQWKLSLTDLNVSLNDCISLLDRRNCRAFCFPAISVALAKRLRAATMVSEDSSRIPLAARLSLELLAYIKLIYKPSSEVVHGHCVESNFVESDLLEFHFIKCPLTIS